MRIWLFTILFLGISFDLELLAELTQPSHSPSSPLIARSVKKLRKYKKRKKRKKKGKGTYYGDKNKGLRENTFQHLKRHPLFVQGGLGLWIPLLHFTHNHKFSPNVNAELGYWFDELSQLFDKEIAVILGGNFSPQTLREHLEAESTVLYSFYGGVRLQNMSNITTNMNYYLSLGFGYLDETAEAEAGHSPPDENLFGFAGAGIDYRLTSILKVGVRADLGGGVTSFSANTAGFACASFKVEMSL